ncbi:MAG: alpha-N-acetylglucosaminidase [Planctomycetaceae bacterium]|nr:alpha-N-acetylglucosaminidase [Planctomycetaceae bacterium]
MKTRRLRTIFLLCVAGLLCGWSRVQSAEAVAPEQAARGVLQRVIPEVADAFDLEVIPSAAGRDVFEIESVDGRLVVRGSSGVAIASGVNWYLKYVCHCHLSFNGDQLDIPRPLPGVAEKIRCVSPYQYRYFFNFCAFSYTLAWWDWDQWQRMIDWMALHGINMPLSVTGQEAVWQNVYRSMGLTDAQLADFFVGPGFLPFGWMGCLDGWGGPLPQSWIDSHVRLQQQIVARERELGMTPVLQGFTGHVPAALRERFPAAKFQQLPSWCYFPGTQFVDPSDPLFEQIGKAFIEEQTRLYGTDHLYASDTFIEMSPPSNDPEFLADMSRAVLGAMQAGDPQAIWVMQGWLFFHNPDFWQPPQAQALFDAVPNERMVVLDLFCEAKSVWDQTEAFHGKPWVWCIIHSFGARVGMYGGLPQILNNLNTALTSDERGDLRGIGVIMEGFGYNPPVYDLMTDMIWRDEVPELDEWLAGFVLRRYGQRVERADQAWELLRRTVYQLPGYSGSVIFDRPSLHIGQSIAYDTMQLAKAGDLLLASAGELGSVDTYQFDAVHLTRQVLGDLAGSLYLDVVDAYTARDQAALQKAGQRYLELMRDIDRLLGTRREFLLGAWLHDATRWGTTDEERRLLEWNARNLITLWGPRDSVLHEYSYRQWSGLIHGFYLRRWELFLERLAQSLESDTAFDAAQFEQEIRAWEEDWTHGTEPYPTEPVGDPVLVSQEIWAKYRESICQSVGPNQVSLSTGKPVSCSSALPQYPATFANDGRTRNTNVYWATDVEIDSEPWWQVDLETPTSISRVVVVPYYDGQRYYGFTVQTSLDGETWKTVADRRDNQLPSTRAGYECRFEPHAARFVRVTMPHNSANTGRHLVEVMVYE